MRLITKKFTLVGVAQSLDYFGTYNERPKAVGLKNDDTANTIVVTIQGALEDGTVDVLPGEYIKLAGEFSKISCLGTGSLRTFACDSVDDLPDLLNAALSGTVPAGSLSADATGRARMAAAFFGAGVAASIAHFAAAFFTAAFVAAKFVAGCMPHMTKKIQAIVACGDTVAGRTLTAAELVNSQLFTSAPSGSAALTTHTAAQIVAAIPGAVVGSWADFSIQAAPTGAFVTTLNGALPAGVTMAGDATLPATFERSGTWRILCTNVTGGAEAVTIMRIA